MRRKNDDHSSLSHTKWNCQYHIIFCPKYRRVKIPPKIAVSSFMGYLKGKSALMIFEEHANLKYKYGRRNFWATGYYVSTVGRNKQAIKKYIKEQELEDQIKDKRSLKEHVDPFKG